MKSANKEVNQLDKKHFATNAVHAGEEKEFTNRPLNTPIYLTSTFTFPDLDTAEKTFDFERSDYVYTRGNNPTIRALEEKMTALEHGNDAVAFASGMAAISSVLLSLLEKGDNLLAHQVLYGSAHNFISEILPRRGVATEFIDLRDEKVFLQKIKAGVDVIYFETPANPTLDIIDLEKIAKYADSYNIKVVVDNTFASPYWQKPLDEGIDIVLHSATKYICGHGDALGGIVVSNDQDYIQKLKFGYMAEYGGVMSPFNAWLMLRGLKTLALRMDAHAKNASQIADFLVSHPKIEKVYYPGQKDFADYQLAQKQMSGFGGIVSFEFAGDKEDIEVFLKKLKLIKLAVSLGDTETLIEYPFAMTHRGYAKDYLEKIGINANLIRISAGIEDVRDLIKDLDEALA